MTATFDSHGLGDAYPRSPWQNRYIERFIGSIRRESLDHLIVIDETHLRDVLKAYAKYYNKVRPHLSLDKDAPDFLRDAKDRAHSSYSNLRRSPSSICPDLDFE